MARQSAVSLLRATRSAGRARGVVGVALLALAAQTGFAAAADRAGEVVIARGVATAHNSGAAARIVGPGSEVFEGDVITTGPRSLALLKLDDGTRVTLRPDTSFQVEEFDTTANQERAVLRLFKGGLRAVTGFMSKRNPDAMRLRTAVATIGIRGTEFDARLCGADCAAEARTLPVPAGRAGFVKGGVIARAQGGRRARALTAGAPVHQGDSVLTSPGAYAVLVFRDKSRVTLLPDTEFRIDHLQYDEATPEAGSGIFNLLRGGLRAVSGAIGRTNRHAYQMRTAVATIGIRGTGYDLVCQGSCQSVSPTPDPSGDGLIADVWEGTIVADDSHEIPAGSTVFIGAPGADPIPLPAPPVPLVEPRPNEVDVPAEEPPPASSTDPRDGLYVSCYVGNCSVKTDENEVSLEPGEAGFVGGEGGAAEQLDEVPPFQPEDPVLNAVETIETGGALNLLDQTIQGGGAECTVR